MAPRIPLVLIPQVLGWLILGQTVGNFGLRNLGLGVDLCGFEAEIAVGGLAIHEALAEVKADAVRCASADRVSGFALSKMPCRPVIFLDGPCLFDLPPGHAQLLCPMGPTKWVFWRGIALTEINIGVLKVLFRLWPQVHAPAL